MFVPTTTDCFMIETTGNTEKKTDSGENPETRKKGPGGRPLAFKSPQELQVKVDEYFSHCDNRMKEVYMKDLGDHVMINHPEPYTMSGLAVWLGVDRQTILNYGAKEEYFGTIKAARARVEADVERRMMDKDTFTPGLIFNAKNNFGWKDKTEVDSNHSGNIGVTMNVLNFSTKQLHDEETDEPTDS